MTWLCTIFSFSISANRNWFHFFLICKEIAHPIAQARNKWLESIQSGSGEAPKIIPYLMDCPDCMYGWGRQGKESRIWEIKCSQAQMLWLWFLGVHLHSARQTCPCSWVNLRGFPGNAPPSVCTLCELPLCMNSVWIEGFSWFTLCYVWFEVAVGWDD